MKPWDTIMKHIPFRREQGKAGVNWAVPKRAAPVPAAAKGEAITPPLPQAMPLPPPVPAVASRVSPVALSAVDAVLQASSPVPPAATAAGPVTPPPAAVTPAAEAGNKSPDKLMDLFLQEEAVITPLQSLTACLPEVTASSLLESCLEAKEKISQRR